MQIRVAFFALALTTALSADFDTESLGKGLTERTDKFLSAPTGDARAQMAQFSDEDLQKITTAFKKEHSASDQRIFWLSEELYRRNAERVAAERIKFLYLAVVAAFIILTGFALLTYRQSRRLPAPAPAAATPVFPATAEPVRKRPASPTKSKRRK